MPSLHWTISIEKTANNIQRSFCSQKFSLLFASSCVIKGSNLVVNDGGKIDIDLTDIKSF